MKRYVEVLSNKLLKQLRNFVKDEHDTEPVDTEHLKKLIEIFKYHMEINRSIPVRYLSLQYHV